MDSSLTIYSMNDLSVIQRQADSTPLSITVRPTKGLTKSQKYLHTKSQSAIETTQLRGKALKETLRLKDANKKITQNDNFFSFSNQQVGTVDEKEGKIKQSEDEKHQFSTPFEDSSIEIVPDAV
jgi:hypothetical protein